MKHFLGMCVAGPNGSFVSTEACNLESRGYKRNLESRGYKLRRYEWTKFLQAQGLIPVGPDICHRGCAYTVLQNGMYSAVYDTVLYKEPLQSFEIRVGHSPGFGIFSVAILCLNISN